MTVNLLFLCLARDLSVNLFNLFRNPGTVVAGVQRPELHILVAAFPVDLGRWRGGYTAHRQHIAKGKRAIDKLVRVVKDIILELWHALP